MYSEGKQELEKLGLVGVAKREFAEHGKAILYIDDDMYRGFYPTEKKEKILKNCPEYYTKITAMATNVITPRIMKFISDRGMNFIFDGTLKNDRIIKTSRGWKNYKINWKIMATSRMESLISIFERNKECNRSRFITVDVHDEIYEGLEPTVEKLENIEGIGRIQVYMRGKTKDNPPRLMYDSTVHNLYYNSAVSALNGARKLSKTECLKNGVVNRIEELRKSKWNNAEMIALGELEREIMQELECSLTL